MRDYVKCSGCRRCEIVCSLHHEGRIWPEASRVRVFMLVPGAEVPHLCAQCEDHPCVGSCPVDALSVDPEMKSIDVDRELCNACGNCGWLGAIDEVVIYQRDLSADEILLLMGKGPFAAVEPGGKLTATWGEIKY